jgi:hypothetical protein
LLQRLLGCLKILLLDGLPDLLQLLAKLIHRLLQLLVLPGVALGLGAGPLRLLPALPLRLLALAALRRARPNLLQFGARVPKGRLRALHVLPGDRLRGLPDLLLQFAELVLLFGGLLHHLPDPLIGLLQRLLGPLHIVLLQRLVGPLQVLLDLHGGVPIQAALLCGALRLARPCLLRRARSLLRALLLAALAGLLFGFLGLLGLLAALGLLAGLAARLLGRGRRDAHQGKRRRPAQEAREP